ncbi:MAG: hypothetical protein K8S23_00985 [Candidatus Cloacimonetes bacterium]|nr:hypothetical protein [Candidatus Cloacimonadota bacterium]
MKFLKILNGCFILCIMSMMLLVVGCSDDDVKENPTPTQNYGTEPSLGEYTYFVSVSCDGGGVWVASNDTIQTCEVSINGEEVEMTTYADGSEADGYYDFNYNENYEFHIIVDGVEITKNYKTISTVEMEWPTADWDPQKDYTLQWTLAENPNWQKIQAETWTIDGTTATLYGVNTEYLGNNEREFTLSANWVDVPEYQYYSDGSVIEYLAVKALNEDADGWCFHSAVLVYYPPRKGGILKNYSPHLSIDEITNIIEQSN